MQCLISVLRSLCLPLLFCLSAPLLAEPRFSFETTPGRLPKTARPLHYELTITPAADGKTFAGQAVIDVQVLGAAKTLQLNTLELKINKANARIGSADVSLNAKTDDASEIATLTRGDGKEFAPGAIKLMLDYQGVINEQAYGLYRLPYRRIQTDGSTVADFILATQGEPAYMRRIFPGWDEPVYRATFGLTVATRKDWTVVANMPVAAETADKDVKRVRFAPTPSMSSYLFAMFIGPWEKFEDSFKGKPLAIYTVPGKREKARYAMEVTKKVLAEYEDYFGQPYTLPKLDQIAVPGGFGGAMENWGAISYNEGALLYDPAKDSPRLEQRIHSIVAHEVAHQWFGNLVTMAWWDNLWLNEGFASWMAGRVTDRFNPQWHSKLAGSRWREEAMLEDARKTTHPIQTPVENEARAMEVFDSITYSKGEAFIRMLETYVGEAAFREGIRRYMAAHKLGNTTTADLWHHLNAASGKDVAAFAASWTEQPGFPVLKITQTCGKGRSEVTVVQQRFTLNDPRAAALFWKVPVTLSAAGAKSVNVLVQRGQEPVKTSLPTCAPVVADANDLGYFRVQYDAVLLAKHLKRIAAMTPSEQLKLVNDSYALAKQGTQDFAQFFAVADALPVSAQAAVWTQLATHLVTLQSMLKGRPQAATLDRRIVRWLEPVQQRTGLLPKKDEDPAIPALRDRLMDALAIAGHKPTLDSASAQFAAWLADDKLPRPNDAVFRAAGANLTAPQWDAALARVLSATSNPDKWAVQSTLRSVRDPALMDKTLALLLTDKLTPGDAVYNLRNFGERSDPQRALAFMQKNWDALAVKSGKYGVRELAPDVMEHFSDAKSAEQLLAWQKEKLGADAMLPAERAADWVLLKATVAEKLIAALKS